MACTRTRATLERAYRLPPRSCSRPAIVPPPSSRPTSGSASRADSSTTSTACRTQRSATRETTDAAIANSPGPWAPARSAKAFLGSLLRRALTPRSAGHRTRYAKGHAQDRGDGRANRPPRASLQRQASGRWRSRSSRTTEKALAIMASRSTATSLPVDDTCRWCWGRRAGGRGRHADRHPPVSNADGLGRGASLRPPTRRGLVLGEAMKAVLSAGSRK